MCKPSSLDRIIISSSLDTRLLLLACLKFPCTLRVQNEHSPAASQKEYLQRRQEDRKRQKNSMEQTPVVTFGVGVK